MTTECNGASQNNNNSERTSGKDQGNLSKGWASDDNNVIHSSWTTFELETKTNGNKGEKRLKTER